MELPARFTPPRRIGLIFHALPAVLLSAAGGFSLWYALQRIERSNIVGLLLLSIVLLTPVPFLVYRAFALLRARYMLDRDGLRVRWGLRSEDIPMPQVEWIRSANELGYHLRLPYLRWPGAILGKRSTEGLGLVEFIASDASTLQLIATPEKVYAISPMEPRRFLNTFRRAVELGSLAPIPSASILPRAFLKRIWADKTARVLVFLGLASLGLLWLISSALVSSYSQLPLGYTPQGEPFPPGPSEFILLLPILGSIVFGADLLLGMFFYYRQGDTQRLAYLLWGTGILTPVLLILAVLLMAKWSTL